MTALKNDRFLRALLKQPVDVTPVWMMRQAGRYLPEYRASRAKAGDFMSLCMNPQFACEVTLQPLDRYPLDAAILFSDILTIPDAMGLGLYFETGEGPRFRKVVSTPADIEACRFPTRKRPGLRDGCGQHHPPRTQRPRSAHRFSGSPWTLATYMVEGGSSKDFRKTKAMAYDNPQALHLLLDKLAQSVTSYLNGRSLPVPRPCRSSTPGAATCQRRPTREFSLAYMRKIVSGLIREHEGRKVPVILFTKNGGLAESIAEAGADALAWTGPVTLATPVAVWATRWLQGNMDPTVLYAKPEAIRQEVARILASYGHGNGHVFNLGHGITPEVDPEHAGVFINAVHELSAQYHV